MSCKNDADWEGSYVYKDNCVKWEDLTDLRKDFNTLWDLLKKEDKENGNKYGYRGEEESVKEQIEPLATIEGFFGLRYDNSLALDEIYFYITAGTILDRLKWLGTQYSYDHQPNGKNFGPWIVWLKDPCHGCTVFRFVNADASYPRHIYCNSQYIPNIDSDAWRLQCIWSSNGCNYPGEVLGDWQQYCHINWDWRDPQYWQQYLRDVADKLFVKGPICVPIDDPCTVTRQWCCGMYAIAHYTEEDAWGEGCDFNGPCEEVPGYVCRRLKYVSLGVTTSNPGEEVHGLFNQDGSSGWDNFFCCPNQITGGQLKGHVTQKIAAVHLTDIWDRTNTMVGDKTLRKCFYNQCKYYQNNEKKYRWVHKENVPMFASGSTADIMDRKETCENCEKVSVGQNICACNFNDINAMLDEYNSATCSCQNEGENKGKSLTNFGDVNNCDCCKTKCCCDCKCTEELTKAECEKKQCKKNGPKWVGVYEKGQSKDDKKLGDAKPCGCYQQGDTAYPDISCMTTCGSTAACCTKNPCACSMMTKCDCDDKNGTWHGFRSNGTPKYCGDQDVDVDGCKRSCGVCAVNQSTCACDCCPSESGCDCGSGCCCCGRDQKPTKQNNTCVCVSSKCPGGSGTGGSFPGNK